MLRNDENELKVVKKKKQQGTDRGNVGDMTDVYPHKPTQSYAAG